MLNVCDFTMSYNYDNSDVMTDYFDTNFYLTLGIGRYDKPYQTELPKLQTKDKLPEVFKHPEEAANKAIRQALGKARFDFIQSRANAGKLILGEDTYGSKGEHYFWPKQYSSAKTAQKRIDKLTEAGMRCRMTKVAAETKAYKKIPVINEFKNSEGNDIMQQQIERNYTRIKADVVQIIEDEMERIANDPNLRHLIPQEDGKQEKQ